MALSDKPDTPQETSVSDAAIRKLRARDKIGVAAEALTTAGGVAAGALSAGTVAGAMGATTLLGSSTLGGVLGTVFVTTTPVGWVVGAAAVGGALGFGVARLVRSGAKQDKLADQIASRIERKDKQEQSSPDLVSMELQSELDQALIAHAINEEDMRRILELTCSGRMSPVVALERVRAIVREAASQDATKGPVPETGKRGEAFSTKVGAISDVLAGVARQHGGTLAGGTRRFMGALKGQVGKNMDAAGRILDKKFGGASDDNRQD